MIKSIGDFQISILNRFNLEESFILFYFYLEYHNGNVFLFKLNK